VQFQGRPACCGNNNCVPICPVHAKYDATVHVKKAQQLGAVLYSSHVVTRLNCNAQGAIETADFLDTRKHKGSVKARYFMVACHAIENPRLLLLSAGPYTPQGVANSSGLVGTHLMSQMGFNSRGLTPDPVYPYRGPQQTSGVVEGRNDPATRGQKAAIGTSVMNDGTHPFFGPQQTAANLIAKGVYGTALAEQVNARSARQLRFNSSIEILPNRENRVTLHPTLKDPAGLPVPAISLAIDDYTQRGIDWARARHEQMFAVLKATDVTHDANAESDTAIIAGTARMGHDPARSVVNPHLQSHDHPNLYILGASAHITAPINPPTLTIAALALRAAEHLYKMQGHAAGGQQ
jgi:choline dehydrogenase-like flavoprotein